MNRANSLRFLICLCFVVLLASACSQVTPTSVPPTAVALAPTATSIPAIEPPATATNTVLPTDTATATLAPTDTATSASAPTDTATATNTLVPPSATRVPLVPTRVPVTLAPRPTLAPTLPPITNNLQVDWRSGIEYLARDGSSRWCQMHNAVQNNTSAEVVFQQGNFTPPGVPPPATYSGYDPVFGIANPDGSLKQWRVGGWYSKLFGWPNGIPGYPAPVPAGQNSGDWTWYSVAQNNGEYCRYVYVQSQGKKYGAEYNAQGQLINRNVTIP